MLDPTIGIVLASFLLVCILWKKLPLHPRTGKAKLLPPGPRRLPLLGNLFDIPTKSPWEVFSKWAGVYGDVVYLEVVGRPIVLLNSVQATVDLFESRFELYSDRPRFPLMDLVGHQWNFGLMNYGKDWRALRRIFSEKFTATKALQSFYSAHRATTLRLLQNTLRAPEAFPDHFMLKSAQLITSITYGIKIESSDDQIVQTTERVMDVTSLALSPCMWLVNPASLAPFIPRWLGGSSVALRLQRWKDDLEDLRNIPFELSKKALNEGTVDPCYVADLLAGPSLVEESSIRDTSAVAFGAALETSVISGEVFILTMTLYPEVQKRAQREIDEVVGPHRLPDFSDRARLPYVSALAKEVMRWHPPAPTGIPHVLRDDDVYRGMWLPKGSIVMGNIWGILHDPTIYPDPMAFAPERYMHDGVFDCSKNDPSRYIFGFGRRVCPGRILAEDALWMTVAQFLAVYRVSLPAGCPPPAVEFISGAIAKPVPFKCNIEPRSEDAKQLIENSSKE